MNKKLLLVLLLVAVLALSLAVVGCKSADTPQEQTPQDCGEVIDDPAGGEHIDPDSPEGILRNMALTDASKGTIYTLQEALDLHYLKSQDLLSIAYYHHSGRGGNEDVIPEDFVPVDRDPVQLGYLSNKRILQDYTAKFHPDTTLKGADFTLQYYGCYGWDGNHYHNNSFVGYIQDNSLAGSTKIETVDGVTFNVVGGRLFVWHLDVDFDFTGDTVIVRLDPDYGGINKEILPSFFENIPVEEVIDLSRRDLTRMTEEDIARFRQSLAVKLSFDDKVGALEVVALLQHSQGIEAAGPNVCQFAEVLNEASRPNPDVTLAPAQPWDDAKTENYINKLGMDYPQLIDRDKTSYCFDCVCAVIEGEMADYIYGNEQIVEWGFDFAAIYQEIYYKSNYLYVYFYLPVCTQEYALSAMKILDAWDIVTTGAINTSHTGGLHTIIPTDSSFDEQWAAETIMLPQAWEITTGSSDIKVGLADTDIDCKNS